jgi:microcystin degradation protein MlrC
MTRQSFRIGIGGIAIECCTFSPLLTRYADFQVHRGAELIALHPPLAQAKASFWRRRCLRTQPRRSGRRDAYEALKSEFLEGIRRNLPLDGLYLSMHGAMFVEGMEDAEADWIGAARAVVGPDCLISASYDLHGNLSPAVVDALDLVTAYRTAPHEDMAETRERAIALLLTCLRAARRPHKALATVPVLLPGERAMTTREPAKSLYASGDADYRPGRVHPCYAWTDRARGLA